MSIFAESGTSQTEGSGNFRAKNGPYISSGVSRSSIGGNFDGLHNLADRDQSILLPKIDGVISFNLSLGDRKNWLEKEVTFVFFSGQGKWQHLTKKVRYGRISDTWRFFPVQTTRVQPFFDIGWGLTWMTVIDGSRPLDVNGPDFWLADGRFMDVFDLHGGGGVAYFVNPHVSVRLFGTYQLTGYSKSGINGVAGALYVYPDKLNSANANMIDIGLKTVYVF